MIEITAKTNCCGCGACAAVCPKGCIKLAADEEGFRYPAIDAAACVNCHLCERVCPLLHKPAEHNVIAVYGAQNVDNAVRLASSSGGVFTLLAQNVLRRGGTVFGAALDEALQVRHIAVNDEENLALLRGSKYVQSDLGNTFAETRSLLGNGQTVLYSGTPCQIAGLRGFLMKDYPKLYTVDVVCHGVPSAKVYNKHLRELAASAGAAITGVRFRDKEKGWKRGETVFYAGEKRLAASKRREPYMQLFLNNVSIRPSCGDCAFNNRRGLADITIADYWGVDKQFPDFDDDLGTTLVIINTAKGARLFDEVRRNARIIATDFAKGAEYNLAVGKSLGLHPRRGSFFAALDAKTLPEWAEELLK